MIQRNTQIIAVIASIFFIVSILASLLFIKQVGDKKEAYASAILRESELKERERSLNDVLSRLEQTEGARASLSTRILKEEDIIDFLAMVESLGGEQGVKLTTSSLSEESINDNFDSLVMNVRVEGLYDAVLHTLRLFEHMPYQSSVHNVSLSSKSESVWEMLFEFRVAKHKN